MNSNRTKSLQHYYINQIKIQIKETNFSVEGMYEKDFNLHLKSVLQKFDRNLIIKVFN